MKCFYGLAAAGLLVVAPLQAETVYVHAGHLIDPERGRTLADQGVKVVDGRVVAVGPWQGTPGDGTVVDWSAYTVLPGLLDCHTHLSDGSAEGDPIQPLASTEAQSVLRGVAAAKVELLSGFTSVRDVGVYRGLTDVALRDAIDNGTVEGPRMIVAGAYITIPGGGGAVTGFAPDVQIPADMQYGYVRNADEARARVDFLFQHGADFIKMIATGAVLALGSEPGALELTPDEMQAACDEARLHGSYCIAHAHGAAGIKAAIRAGVRSIEHASLIDDEGITMAKQAGVWLDMDIYDGDWINDEGVKQGWPAEYLRKNRETTDEQRDGFAKAVKAGVKLSFGTDAGVYRYGLGARQFAYMVRYGMTPMQAIQAATTVSAELMRRSKDVGALSPGHYGDMIAVAGDPLHDIRLLEDVKGVIKGGEVVKAPR
ncbi:Xaa-Pro dipeptidase [Sphingomonas abietis]|uniref:Amidohydrolase family protein n=1 Tax=Sphingomonas abietis TaxID=3012344 RepID=A0ABY7NKJ1_9SPHN|nr:amidohydrolase family protein [Sphingomonas abietis]WBO22046.1 amidohydrolase family protein [Sphingomonas abietis]